MHAYIAEWSTEKQTRARIAFAVALLLVLGAVLYQAALKFSRKTNVRR